ncbi:tripartite tricarboxylate transporter substrate binding protein, partial [Streptomyces sp. NPDC048425]
MRGPARALLGTVAVPTLLTVSACGVIPGGQAQSDRDLRIMVPNTPGGGYDTTARTAARVMDETHISPDVQVFNLPGAGGTVGLRRIVDERGNGQLALQMGLGVVGASHEAKAKVTVARTTPIARLIEE